MSYVFRRPFDYIQQPLPVVLYPEPIENIQLSSTINTTWSVSSNITNKFLLTSSINTTWSVSSDITNKFLLSSSITTTWSVSSDILLKFLLTSSINTTWTVSSDITQLGTIQLTATINTTWSISSDISLLGVSDELSTPIDLANTVFGAMFNRLEEG